MNKTYSNQIVVGKTENGYQISINSQLETFEGLRNRVVEEHIAKTEEELCNIVKQLTAKLKTQVELYSSI